MPWARHRLPLVLAAALDGVGLAGLAVAVVAWRIGLERDGLALPLSQQLGSQRGLLLALVLIYWTLGWLFGSYTLLKLRSIRWPQVLVRLGSTSAASIAAGALLGWILRVAPEVTLLHRGSLIPLFGLASLWSGVVRLWLRRHLHLGSSLRWQIVALQEERDQLARDWTLTATPGPLPQIVTMEPGQGFPGRLLAEAVALSAGVATLGDMQIFCQQAVGHGQPVRTLVELAERELQRIPPRWVGNQWLLFSSHIDGQRSTVPQQLKRYADVVISLVLLLLSTPLLLLAAALVRLQDGGPVLYRQRRTGLFGQPFKVLKIRTMVQDAEEGTAQWAQVSDQRITPVGLWLRRTRVDELPQLLNVLRGEMSLIGPRPERPELEVELENRIPNYRLRHWVRPGLSGWAQVNMPYGASVEDAELKLSYDLFYLRNASLWLDLLILLKTIKTVLKGAGR